MSDIRVARRYAKSLVQITQEVDVLEAIHEDMLLVRNTIESSRELNMVLKSPVVNAGKKRQILEALFGERVGDITQKFFRILIRKGREGILLEVSRQVHLIYNEINDIQAADVLTPFTLTDALREEFVAAVKSISGKQGVELHQIVQPDLIGGYILRIGDRQINDSVRSRLANIRRELLR
ncbi:MAG: ATP synthase F1 subunit delta [Bernardetiaceae bacterium]